MPTRARARTHLRGRGRYLADSATAPHTAYAKVSVPAKGVRTVRVPFDRNDIDLLDHCEADPRARLAD
ncbi:hypothetical protein [Streptomyces filipinensis]|nr:hypothetical protein [Streptomyces filipinensis]